MPHGIQERLDELQREYAVGEEQLRDLEAKQTRLRETMLRIQGAIEVLRELLESEKAEGDSPKAEDQAPAARPRDLGLFDTESSTGFLPGPFDINLYSQLPPNVRC